MSRAITVSSCHHCGVRPMIGGCVPKTCCDLCLKDGHAAHGVCQKCETAWVQEIRAIERSIALEVPADA